MIANVKYFKQSLYILNKIRNNERILHFMTSIHLNSYEKN